MSWVGVNFYSPGSHHLFESIHFNIFALNPSGQPDSGASLKFQLCIVRTDDIQHPELTFDAHSSANCL